MRGESDMDEESETSPRETRQGAEGAAGCGEDGFVRNEADKQRGSRFTLICAFSCAWAGFVQTLRSQRNMKIHLAMAALAVVLGAVLAIDIVSWIAITVAIALVLAAECLNTAIEAVVDLVSPDYRELARCAKDCAAGAVLICALGAAAVGLMVFIPRLINYALG